MTAYMEVLTDGGRLDVHCKDFTHTPLEGTAIEKVKGEEVMLAPLEGMVCVRSSDEGLPNRELGIRSGQSFASALDEKAVEIEEWLKLN